MLLNLSNHPSSYWPDNQMEWAINIYGKVKDLPFPHVDPNLNEVALDKSKNISTKSWKKDQNMFISWVNSPSVWH